MSNWTEAELKAQYERVVNNGWVTFFEKSAAVHAFAPEFLMAIASRETNMQNIKGDQQAGVFHGFGIMQIDVASYPEFCRTWTPAQVQPSIEYATQVLAQKRDILAGHHILDLKSIAASYNTGQNNVCRSYAQHRDVDSTTTGRDYGRDVLNRMEVFARLHSRRTLPKAA